MQLAMIGLGRMGGNMVRRLLQGEHELIVYDSSADRVLAHVAKGVKAAKDLADVVRLLPPYIVESADIEQMESLLDAAFAAVGEGTHS